MKKSILKQNTINLEDVVQVIVGSSALSVPVAFSEESWKLSHELPWGNIAALLAVSLIFINLYSIILSLQEFTNRIFPRSSYPSNSFVCSCFRLSSRKPIMVSPASAEFVLMIFLAETSSF